MVASKKESRPDRILVVVCNHETKGRAVDPPRSVHQSEVPGDMNGQTVCLSSACYKSQSKMGNVAWPRQMWFGMIRHLLKLYIYNRKQFNARRVQLRVPNGRAFLRLTSIGTLITINGDFQFESCPSHCIVNPSLTPKHMVRDTVHPYGDSGLPRYKSSAHLIELSSPYHLPLSHILRILSSTTT
jgi:hypothetical protein